MSLARRARWMLFAAGVVVLFWLCALFGSWAPDITRLSVNVHGQNLASYSADSAILAPLSSQVVNDASKDQAAAPPLRPTPGGSPTPSGTSSGRPTPSPTGPGPSPTLPLPSLPTLPPTPTPLPTLSLPPTPSVLPTPPLP